MRERGDSPAGVIHREMTPSMVKAGFEVLERYFDALSSGAVNPPDVVAQIFGAMRAEQLRIQAIDSEPHKSDPR